MLAGRRWIIPIFVSTVVFLGATLPAQGQINGIAPSVTSFGFGGSTNPAPGVPASVTSLGPNGFANGQRFFNNGAPFFGACCPNIFLNPSHPNPPLFSGGHRHRHHAENLFVLAEPVYVPYAFPYAVESDDESEESDYANDPRPRRLNAPLRREQTYDPAPRPNPTARPTAKDRDAEKDIEKDPAPAPDPDPVIAQPSTVLVFKDGHQADVTNYAIVGEALFDFDAGHRHKILLADLDLAATRKANDERGVDFQVPSSDGKR